MKRIIKNVVVSTVLVLVGALAGISIWNGLNKYTSDKPRLTATEAPATEKGLKAEMTDPKTGKKIKYWVAPMNPTYIRNEPGKSPMGMDLVPVYEEEGEEKESASTIRIDPGTIQNMVSVSAASSVSL